MSEAIIRRLLLALDGGDWDENAHPRGQPGNAGQFGSGGGGASALPGPSKHLGSTGQRLLNGVVGALQRGADAHTVAELIKTHARGLAHPAHATYANTLLRAVEDAHALPTGSLGKAAARGQGGRVPPAPPPEPSTTVEPEPSTTVEPAPLPPPDTVSIPEPSVHLGLTGKRLYNEVSEAARNDVDPHTIARAIKAHVSALAHRSHAAYGDTLLRTLEQKHGLTPGSLGKTVNKGASGEPPTPPPEPPPEPKTDPPNAETEKPAPPPEPSSEPQDWRELPTEQYNAGYGAGMQAYRQLGLGKGGSAHVGHKNFMRAWRAAMEGEPPPNTTKLGKQGYEGGKQWRAENIDKPAPPPAPYHK